MFVRFVATSIVVFASIASAQESGLDFAPASGSPNNAYVTFGNPAALGLASFTLETWFNRQGTGISASTGSNGVTLVPLVTKGAPEADGSNLDANYVLGISTTGNVLAADFEEGTGGPGPLGNNHPVVGVTPIQSNVWYHAAATYDGTTWRLYLNGELEAELLIGAPARSDSVQHAGLATMLTSTGAPNGFFDGRIDEARIWGTARTAAQIRAAMNVQNPSDPNLVARWGLGEGSGTTVGDSAGSAQNGSIVGTNFSWTTGAPFDVAPCANATNTMLRFDGTNDYVTFGNAAELGLSTFTVETWFKREGTGTVGSTGTGGIATFVPLVSKGAPQADGAGCPTGDGRCDGNYILGINTTGNVIAADFEDTATGGNHPLSGTTAIVSNNWHHAAVTFDGTTMRLYLDGNLEGSLAPGATPRFDSLQPAALAGMLTTTGTPATGAFAGLLDEVRIWNLARTQAQIQSAMSSQLTSGTGLVARWGLGENMGTTIADSVGSPATSGTLTNGPTWTASNALFDATGTCDDGAFCTGADTCNGSQLRCATHAGNPCAGGPQCNNVCDETLDNCAVAGGTPCTDDGNACTDDQCNGAGSCTHPNNTAPCDDGDACTTVDVCAGGTCVGSTPPNCDDGNTCTDDDCDPGSGCTHTNNTAPCSDGSACTVGDTCSGGSCDPGAPPNCDDGNVCTNDGCNPASGCTHANNTVPCSDGSVCTVGDTCSGGVCAGGSSLNCDDGNPCTDDGCNPVSGCTHSNNTAPCGDGNACTSGDACNGGACVPGPPLDCNDSNACTDDTCNPGSGCVNTNNTSPCNDGNACTTNDTCAGGSCAGGSAPDCNDFNVCTTDTCIPASGCQHTNNAVACSDGNACTVGDVCGGGSCTSGAAANCDDTNPCTTDSCNPATGCTHSPIAGCCNVDSQCADSDMCSTNERCVGHACISDPVSCNDGNPCTDDSCNPVSGCVHVFNNAPCNDGNSCTTGDACNGGTCQGGPPPNCNDGNPCTTDSCTPTGGCTHTNNTVPCNDGLFCTVNDTCSGGSCTGSPRDCSAAGGECRTGQCNESLGQCIGPPKPDGTPCQDGNACTSGETCANGICTTGTPVVCAACEICEPNAGCQKGPRPTCRGPVLPLKGKIQISDRVPNAGDLVAWKLMKGDATTISEFRDPTMTNSYTLCIFDEDGGRLALSLVAPAGGTCGTGPCWRPISTIGYKYTDQARTPQGVAKVLLKSSLVRGGTTIHLKAKGDNIPPFALPLTTPVVAQLQSTNGPCWKTQHVGIGVLRNDPGQFKAKDD